MSELETQNGEGIDVTDVKDGGVFKVITKEGSGTDTPCEGANVFVHYVGKFVGGSQFDSSRDTGKPLEFMLGKGQVIPAWELGIETMRKGEICTLTCQPEYAYGKAGRPPTIPANATLVFEIELLYWVDEEVTGDSLVSKKILKKGKGSDHVADGGTVNVHIVGRDGDRVFDERDVQFVVGEGMLLDVIPGVDAAVKTMKKGETSIITSDSSHAFGENGRPEWGISPDALVTYEVHLKSFEQLKPHWELSSEERVESAKIAKERGTEYFKQGKYSLALSKFDRLISLVESLTVAEELKEISPMILAGHLNVALCYLKLGKYRECMESCDKALFRDENNVKALYRKARAQLALGYLDESKKLFQRVLELDPNNRDARHYCSIVKKKLEEHKKKEKEVFGNMFEKFAAQDAKHLAISREKETKGNKDVFERAKEEAKITFGEETAENSEKTSTNTSDVNNIHAKDAGEETSGNSENTSTNASDVNNIDAKDAGEETAENSENTPTSTSDLNSKDIKITPGDETVANSDVNDKNSEDTTGHCDQADVKDCETKPTPSEIHEDTPIDSVANS